MEPISQKIRDRFFAKTTTDHDFSHNGTPCIIWTASAGTRNGYGRFWDGNRRCWVAHRFAYVMEHGEIPDGMELDHLCRRNRCVNYLHLEPVTGCENIRRQLATRLHQLTCPAGHLWTWENIYLDPRRGYRNCRACSRAAVRQAYRTRRRNRKHVGAMKARALIADDQQKRSAVWKRRQKLTPEQVEEIRRDKRNGPETAAAFGVSKTTVYRIRSGETWAPWNPGTTQRSRDRAS